MSYGSRARHGPWGWRELERRLLYRWQDARAN